MSDEPTTILDTPVNINSPAGSNEVQKLDYSGVTAGKTTTLTFDGDTTGNLKAKAELTAAEIQQALEDLETIPDGGVAVSGSVGGPYTVVFNAESFEDADVPALTAAAAEGSAPVVTVVNAGVDNEGPPAVVTGTGDADRTEDVSPLTGDTPAEHRVANKADYGDA
jgi:hypothetical protein